MLAERVVVIQGWAIDVIGLWMTRWHDLVNERHSTWRRGSAGLPIGRLKQTPRGDVVCLPPRPPWSVLRVPKDDLARIDSA